MNLHTISNLLFKHWKNKQINEENIKLFKVKCCKRAKAIYEYQLQTNYIRKFFICLNFPFISTQTFFLQPNILFVWLFYCFRLSSPFNFTLFDFALCLTFLLLDLLYGVYFFTYLFVYDFNFLHFLRLIDGKAVN